MRIPFAFIQEAAAGGAVPVVSAIAPNVGDTAGGGGRVVITVDDSTGATGATLGGVALTSFAIDDGTHVSGIPGAHAAGAVAAVVTNATGPSTTGGTPFEYWTLAQVTGVLTWWDAEKGVTDAAGAVTDWLDQEATNNDLSDGTTAPTYTANAFGTLHGVTCVQATPSYMTCTRDSFASSTWSVRFGMKTTSTDATATQASVNPPNTILGDDDAGVLANFGMSNGAVHLCINDPGDGFAWKSATAGAGLNDGSPHVVGANLTGTSAECVADGAAGASTVLVGGGIPGFNRVGLGYSASDGFDGTIAWGLIVDGAISGGDETKLNTWSRQRWGTP